MQISNVFNLMDNASNKESSSSGLQSAYRKAMEQLKGLLTVPDRDTQVIGKSVRREELITEVIRNGSCEIGIFITTIFYG